VAEKAGVNYSWPQFAMAIVPLIWPDSRPSDSIFLATSMRLTS
jgi:hypothetical protein